MVGWLEGGGAEEGWRMERGMKDHVDIRDEDGREGLIRVRNTCCIYELRLYDTQTIPLLCSHTLLRLSVVLVLCCRALPS